MCNFFGVRHGKGPCDGCAGRVKQVSLLVKTEEVVVNRYCLVCCLLHYYCIVNNHIIIAFVNSSLYSNETYTQVKEMDNLNLFIESPLQIQVFPLNSNSKGY